MPEECHRFRAREIAAAEYRSKESDTLRYTVVICACDASPSTGKRQ